MPTERNPSAQQPPNVPANGLPVDVESGSPVKKGKWALVAEEIARKGYLNNCSDRLIELGKEFRESFFSRHE